MTSSRHLTFWEKQALEKVLEMEGGYVLDFSNRTIASFFADFGVDLYDPFWEERGTSKANRVRFFVATADIPLVGQVLDALLEHRRNIGSEEPSERMLAAYVGLAARLGGGAEALPDGLTQITSPAQRRQSDPVLPMKNYEHILQVCSSMADVMERAPAAFAAMEEEHLRHHFVAQLNGHYKGGGSGETFNFSGKTDILLRHHGQVLFIAECKFWDGAKTLTDAIDQLLGYATWRDTKLAILLFSRRASFSSVVYQVPQIVRMHPNFVQEIEYASESGVRALMRNPQDHKRHAFLTVLAFNLSFQLNPF